MVLTITNVKKGIAGDLKYSILTVDFDASYPTGGEPLTAADLGMTVAHRVEAQSTSGYVFEYDHANAKLLAYYVDNNGASDSAMIQVPNTTDLATLTGVRVIVWGQ